MRRIRITIDRRRPPATTAELDLRTPSGRLLPY
jgi:hypothetical protein